ncbi:MAG TPA: sugar isomerase, partial [Phycisphaerae bacterium]|nr:sugar isomerase [Phycisphaerae bacterium]
DIKLAWMVDQSHNIKPKIQAQIQTVMAIQELFAKALLVDRKALAAAQAAEDVIGAETVLRDAFTADVSGILKAVRKNLGVPANPLKAFRDSGYEEKAAKTRIQKRKDLGINEGGAFA